MISFLAKRLIQTFFTLSFLVVATFFLLRLAPGGPFDGDRVWPADVQANIEAKYGLDKPVYQQFFSWAGDLLHGDLRESFHYVGTPVSEIIRDAVPASLELGVWALLIFSACASAFCRRGNVERGWIHLRCFLPLQASRFLLI